MADGGSTVNASPDKQKDSEEMDARPIQWVSGTPPLPVAIVSPLQRNVNGGPLSLSSNSSTPQSSHGHVSPVRIGTQPRPFSFFERDSLRRAAYNRRLEELRQEEERKWQMMAPRFRANPIRQYKPLVRKPSRPLTIPTDPFSREYN